MSVNVSPKGTRLPDGRAHRVNDCGDELEFRVTVRDWAVHEVAVSGRCCGNMAACARAAISLVQDKPLGQAARELSPQTVFDAVEDLPEHEIHAAEFVAEVLTAALMNAIEGARDPWRKMYNQRGS